MLRAASELTGLGLEAKDGRIGSVEDLYFDDEDWTVRYLVASTGSWLAGRRVLLSPHALGKPDLVNKVLPVDLTQDQIRKSPGLETDKPVSRQFETSFYDYYDYPYYWRGPYIWGGAAFPYYPLAAYPPIGEAAAAETARKSARQEEDGEKGDPHLRSVEEVRGYHVEAVDGSLGHIQDILLDEKDWSIRYLAIDTRNWLPGKHVVVPAEWARNIRWEDRKVTFDHLKEEIRNAPEHVGIGYITPEYTRALESYYEESGRRA